MNIGFKDFRIKKAEFKKDWKVLPIAKILAQYLKEWLEGS